MMKKTNYRQIIFLIIIFDFLILVFATLISVNFLINQNKKLNELVPEIMNQYNVSLETEGFLKTIQQLKEKR